MYLSPSAISFLLLAPLATAILFSPETGGILANGLDTLPIPYNFTESQRRSDEFGAGSFWSSSFIHGSNNHSYLVVSHVMADVPFWTSGRAMYRGSVLDITNTSEYSQFEFFVDDYDVFSDSGDFDAVFSNYSLISVGTNGLQTWSNISGAEFDLTIEFSSPVLLNGGLGSFEVNNSTLYQWSLPAGKTTGWLSVDGSKVNVDTERSLTWYDRQWNGGPSDWTWFELHLDTGKSQLLVPVSAWTWQDSTSGLKGLASIREEPGTQKVVPVKSLEPSGRTWTSEASGTEYALDWVLELTDGTKLNISSVRDDQELSAEGGEFPAYAGYITAEGNFGDSQNVHGYGVVEVVPPGNA